MAVDRRNGLQEVERLLKQGKLQAALGELQRVSDQSSQDLFTLNRLGDLLARQGRRAEAIEYYQKIAEQFSQGGFVPKAVAIHKKILRLDPQNLHSIVQLGELYFRENLKGEAREYLLHAVNQYLEAREFDRAREILERLVAIDPKDVRHRVRLAEARAAAGETREAGEELLGLGRTLLDEDRAGDAEPLYRRAAELIPDSHLPTLGLARCLTQHGRPESALVLLEAAVAKPNGSPAVVAELALCYDAVGRSDEALEMLTRSSVLEIPHSVWKTLLRGFVARGGVDAMWERLGPAFDGDLDPAGFEALLDTLVDIEDHGHVPALQRLLALRKGRSDLDGTVRTLTALLQAYESRSMSDEASLMREELSRLTPKPPEAPPRPSAAAAPVPSPRRTAPSSAELAVEVEAPPVPLNRADEEFVAGRLTQAEVLEKYGLRPQALEQVDEVTARYPGHVGAQEARVKLLRAMGEHEALGEALAQLAIARRAEGDAAGARESAEEAAAGTLTPAARRTLEQVGLVGSPEPAAPTAERAEAPDPDPGEDAPDEDVDLVIDFDEAELDAPSESPETVADDLGARVAVADEPEGNEDLRAIAEALECELLAAENDPIAPGEEREQAFEEVFSTFKEQVAAEVDAEDYRTHYDLGIAYKEMGLVDEAIREFEVASASTDLEREACTMVAICHRESTRTDEATRWYRRALAATGVEETGTALRYDLAEALLEAGDARAALEEFRGLLGDEPSFRDVAGRVAELESLLEA